VVNFDVIAWFTHNAKLRLIANCRLRDHSRITHYPFTQSLQKLPLPPLLNGLIWSFAIHQARILHWPRHQSRKHTVRSPAIFALNGLDLRQGLYPKWDMTI